MATGQTFYANNNETKQLLEVKMKKIIPSGFWAFALTNVVILLLSSFLGLLGVGIWLCVALYALIIHQHAPVLIRSYKNTKDEDAKKEIGRRLNRLFFYYLFAVHIPLVALSIILFYTPASIVAYLSDVNAWFTSAMYEIVPAIRNHVDLAVQRGDQIAQLYRLILSSFYFWMFISVFPIVFNVTNTVRFARLHIKTLLLRQHEKLVLRLLSVLLSIVIYMALFLAFLYQDGTNNSVRGFSSWDTSYDDNFVVFGLFQVSWITILTLYAGVISARYYFPKPNFKKE